MGPKMTEGDPVQTWKLDSVVNDETESNNCSISKCLYSFEKFRVKNYKMWKPHEFR